MKIGFSIKPNFLYNEALTEQDKIILKHYGNAAGFMRELKASGVTSIEFRGVDFQDDPQQLFETAESIWDIGLEISIHAHLHEIKADRFDKIFPATSKFLEKANIYQKDVIYTVHCFSDKSGNLTDFSAQTAQTLREWLSITEQDGFIKFALELNRAKGICDPSTTDDGVTDMTDKAKHNRLGACWDMGHYYYNYIYGSGKVALSPGNRFLSTVNHTHIHGVDTTGTHAPLNIEKYLPLESYIKALKAANYSGIYNIELSFNKLQTNIWHEEIFKTIDRLKDALYG